MSEPRHFLDIDQLDSGTLRNILNEAGRRKTARLGQSKGLLDEDAPLKGKVLAMIFDQPSTRTRVSFDMAMRQLGGEALLLSGNDMQIGRGETVADTARVLSRYVDAIMIRAKSHDMLNELAEYASVPVINALTDRSHPCQLMADVMTLEEHCGPAEGKVVTWSGDGNNVAASWIHGAARFGYELRMACPEEMRPNDALIRQALSEGAKISETTDAMAAAKDADCITTDCWVSMHDDPASDPHNLLAPFRVTAEMMAQARENAIFMHCLPAHRGEEVTDEVIEGPQSVVFDEAENRLHAQKAILTWCLGLSDKD